MRSLLRRLPAHVVNGVSVGVGVALVQLLFGAAAQPGFAQAASIGAVLASLPHRVGRAGPMFRRSLLGGLLASLATLLMLCSADQPVLRGAVLALISFLALMGMAWGARAAPCVFSVIIGVVFSLARPSTDGALGIALASACGAVAYALYALVNARLLEPRYRELAVHRVLDAAAALLHARAAVLAQAQEEAEGQAAARFVQLSEEVRLAEMLQNARDLVYPAANRRHGAVQVALLSRVAELREIVLTSRLDLDLLGHDHAARFVRARLALGLRQLAATLEDLAVRQRDGGAQLPRISELPDILAGASLLHDERTRLLPVVAARLRYLCDEVEAIAALLGASDARSSLRPTDLAPFVADDDTWPLSAVREHLAPSSPVLRHALRSVLAFTSVYAFAYALPWTTRPYWMLLSVAVVLRGTLDDTLSRRNLRVLGTAIGCVAVTVLIPLASDPLLKVVFVLAVGMAHAFVNVRYLLTAIAATLMALLQAHFASPILAPLVVERLLDTVIGALFAWGFSYVLPSWERRSLPVSLERALQTLRDYVGSALTLDAAAPAGQRLARQRAYDALAVVAAAVQRSAAEPPRVRPPVKELVSALDHAQRLMAHLSSLRTLLQHRSQQLPVAEARSALEEARTSIDQCLALAGAMPQRQVLPSQQQLPSAPAEQSPLPWLVRRLAASAHDAAETGMSARHALQELARRS